METIETRQQRTKKMDRIGNNYGAALTVQECVEMFREEPQFQKALDNNLAMRFFLDGRGFSRVSRAFAAEVMALALRVAA